MVEIATRSSLNHLTPVQRVPLLQQIAENSFNLLVAHQFPNGLIPASLGRFDDKHFQDMVWVKDAARSVQFALDPFFRQAFPNLVVKAEQLYLTTMKGILKIQTQPGQTERFKARPGAADKEGYSTIPDDQQVPVIKFHGPDGSIIQDWGHNQPDNWGILLLEAGKGIEAGLPVLEAPAFNPGQVLAEITSYMADLRIERFRCRSIWENDVAWSSYSTRRISLAGLEQMMEVWNQVEEDSGDKNYKLPITRKRLSSAIKNLRNLVREHSGDFTAERNHPFAGDLASLVVINDIDVPIDEEAEAIKRVIEGELENTRGFYRWLGDGWKKGVTEAKWTMGKPILARYYFRKAIELAQLDPNLSRQKLDHGIDRMQHILDIVTEYGYIPELFEHDPQTDVYNPNSNDLAWTRSYVIEAASAGIVALKTLPSYQQAA